MRYNTCSSNSRLTYLGEGTIVPDVPVVGETVADIPQLAFLNVLLDGVEGLLLGDLHLRVGPTGNFDDHVEDAIVLISEERDVVERRHDRAILLDVNAMLCFTISLINEVAMRNFLPRVLGAPMRRGVYSATALSTTRKKEEETRTRGHLVQWTQYLKLMRKTLGRGTHCSEFTGRLSC